MVKQLFAFVLFFSFAFSSYCQTQYRNDAGLTGNNGATSGFFESSVPVNFPSGATSWWHLLDVRHGNGNNNYAMQFAGSFFNQELYFRKTNDNAAQGWSRVVTEINGRVGINTINPLAPLHVMGNSLMEDNLKILAKAGGWVEGVTVVAPNGWGGVRFTRLDPSNGNYNGNWAIGYTGFSGDDFSISNHFNNVQNDAIFHISASTRNIGIGTTTPNEKLAVNGKIRAKEIKVEPNPATWPDYVFDNNYEMASLTEIEKYIKENKHLPEIPTAKEVASNGLELGEMNRLLLKKVEELTLLLIDQNKKLGVLAAEVEKLKKK